VKIDYVKTPNFISKQNTPVYVMTRFVNQTTATTSRSVAIRAAMASVTWQMTTASKKQSLPFGDVPDE